MIVTSIFLDESSHLQTLDMLTFGGKIDFLALGMGNEVGLLGSKIKPIFEKCQ